MSLNPLTTGSAASFFAVFLNTTLGINLSSLTKIAPSTGTGGSTPSVRASTPSEQGTDLPAQSITRMQPLYETPADIANEIYALAHLGKKYGGTFKLHPYGPYGPDALWLRRKKTPVTIEIKTRDAKHRPIAEELGYMLSLNKALKISKSSGLLLIQWTDGEYWITKPKPSTYPVKTSGRTTNTRTKHDIEQCIFIPHTDFIKSQRPRGYQ